MSMSEAMRQMPARAGRAGVGRGEAAGESVSDEAEGPRHDPNDAGNPHATLLHAAFTRENLQRAFKRVRANQGAAGVDGLDIDQTARLLTTTWPAIREQLLKGTYRPQPVRRVATPKPEGGERELGGLAQTPTVWRVLDEGLRRRLRAIQLKPWRRGRTMYRELRALGATHEVARRVAANSRCWWRNSAKLLNSVLTIAWFDRLGLPRLS